MKLGAWVLVVVAVPAAAHAHSRLNLLAGQTLRATPNPATSVVHDEYPPTPPPPPPTDASPPAPAPAPEPVPAMPEPEAPGLGPVLGYMITGGVISFAGVIYTIYGAVITVAGLSLAGSNSYASSGGAGLLVAGILVLLWGVAHDAVGVWLLIKGNALRVERSAYNEAHGVSEAPPPRPPWAPGALALSF